ncbi:hypothetical protein Tsp_04766 [Trichinella spiralis]|uniref:hypothetical protein n=1 Tax=Trichinella spiralis TaxID=6334 RepID=UPI0001EFDBFE|nr:hypothetical protein Tsp_04766 [Trichinella spiralis]
MNLMKTLSIDCCARRRSCDGLTTSLIAQSIVHFHVSRHSLRPDLSQPLECMPCFQSSARVNCPAILSRRRWYALNGIIISEAKANTTEDSCQLCQRIDDSSLFIINVASRRASDDSQRLTTQAAAQAESIVFISNYEQALSTIRQRKLSKPTTTSRSMHTTHNRNPFLIFNYKPEISFSGSKIKIAPIVTQRDPQV